MSHDLGKRRREGRASGAGAGFTLGRGRKKTFGSSSSLKSPGKNAENSSTNQRSLLGMTPILRSWTSLVPSSALRAGGSPRLHRQPR